MTTETSQMQMKIMTTYNVTIQIGQYEYRTVQVDACSPSEARSIIRSYYDDAPVMLITWEANS